MISPVAPNSSRTAEADTPSVLNVVGPQVAQAHRGSSASGTQRTIRRMARRPLAYGVGISLAEAAQQLNTAEGAGLLQYLPGYGSMMMGYGSPDASVMDVGALLIEKLSANVAAPSHRVLSPMNISPYCPHTSPEVGGYDGDVSDEESDVGEDEGNDGSSADGWVSVGASELSVGLVGLGLGIEMRDSDDVIIEYDAEEKEEGTIERVTSAVASWVWGLSVRF